MRTSIFFSRLATLSFAMRSVLVAGLFVLSVVMGQAQTNLPPAGKTQINSTNNQVTTLGLPDLNQTHQTTAPNIEGTSLKTAGNAPSVNEPDYEAKKQEWIKNHPEEYKKLLESNNTTTGNEKPQTRITYPEKVAPHAPALDDPKYTEKKEEWMKTYPEEYKSIH